MTIADKDLRTLNALEKAKSRQKDLAAYLDFYAELLGKQFEFKASLTGEPAIHNENIREQRLADGVAQLTFEQLGIEAKDLAELADVLWSIMVSHNPEWDDQRESMDSDELLALARQEFETQSPFKAPPPTDRKPTEVLLRMALAPYLQRAADAILPLLDLGKWRRGYCPVCGGQPHFSALKEEGARWLLCSRCSSEWQFTRMQCPFCGNADHSKLAYYTGDDELYRLHVCKTCNRYLKTIDLRQAGGRVLAIEQIVTVGMDISARTEGYR